MTKYDKVPQLVLRLIKLTTNNELSWNVATPHTTELPSGDYILDKVYTTLLGEARFRLYRYSFRSYYDPLISETVQRVRLELTDNLGHVDYEFDHDNSMNDLYDLVRARTSNVNAIVQTIIAPDLDILDGKYYTERASLDVTKPRRDKIEDNKLAVTATNELAGDPDPGTAKRLLVRYRYSGAIFQKEVAEGQLIRLPYIRHIL